MIIYATPKINPFHKNQKAESSPKKVPCTFKDAQSTFFLRSESLFKININFILPLKHVSTDLI